MHFVDLINERVQEIQQLFPWDLVDRLKENADILLLDLREPDEFNCMHIKHSVNVPRGILESACEWGYEETLPELVQAREREVVAICRSGFRSVLAAHTMQRMGYTNVFSLRTGLRGWADHAQGLVGPQGQAVELDAADDYFVPKLSPEQLKPND